MVATDVASRGIGEYKKCPLSRCALPSLRPPCQQLPASLLLCFTLVSRGYLDCAILPATYMSTWFSSRGVWVRGVAWICLFAMLVFLPLYRPHSHGTSVEVASLDHDQVVTQGSLIRGSSERISLGWHFSHLDGPSLLRSEVQRFRT